MTVAELIAKLQTMPQHAEITHESNAVVTEIHDAKLYGADDEATMFVCID